jgi:Zn-dependent metalloprotease
MQHRLGMPHYSDERYPETGARQGLASPTGSRVTSSPQSFCKPPNRTIFDARNRESLPGNLVRRETDDPTDDDSVTEAYDGLGHTHALFRDAYARASIDDENLPLLATVHYGRFYDNASGTASGWCSATAMARCSSDSRRR